MHWSPTWNCAEPVCFLILLTLDFFFFFYHKSYNQTSFFYSYPISILNCFQTVCCVSYRTVFCWIHTTEMYELFYYSTLKQCIRVFLAFTTFCNWQNQVWSGACLKFWGQVDSCVEIVFGGQGVESEMVYSIWFTVTSMLMIILNLSYWITLRLKLNTKIMSNFRVASKCLC